MFGIIEPPVTAKPAMRYQCRDCGYKIMPITKLLLKKCPSCGGINLRFSIDFVDKKPPFPIVH